MSDWSDSGLGMADSVGSDWSSGSYDSGGIAGYSSGSYGGGYSGSGGDSSGGSSWSPNWGNALLTGLSAYELSRQPGGMFGNTQAGMNAADPFASQRGQYQQMLPGVIQGYQASPASMDFGTAMGSAAGWAQMPGINPQLQGMAGKAGLNAGMQGALGGMPNANRLEGATGGQQLTGYMANQAFGPDQSMNFRYQQGLDSISRGMAQSGMMGSGNQMVELEKYGQGFASQEMQAMYNRQSQTQQIMNNMQSTNYGQQAQTFQSLMGQQQQHFGQEQALQGITSGLQQQNFSQLGMMQEFENQKASQQFSQTLQGANFQNMALSANTNKQIPMMNLLAQLSGANTGSPGEAGKIAVGAYQGKGGNGSALGQTMAHGGVGGTLGMVAGAALGGPVGALLGGTLGSLF